MEGFEAEHRSNNALDGPMILFNEIVQILVLTDFYGLTGFFLQCFESRGIGATLIDGHFERKAVLAHGFLEKAQSGLFVAVSREQEVDGLASLVDSTVEIHPLALDLDVRLVCSPAHADQALVAFAESSLEFRRELLNPAVNAGMINFDAALFHHLLQIPIAERIGQIPADTDQDEVLFKSVAFEANHVGLLESR
jgi:hypothetical protein